MNGRQHWTKLVDDKPALTGTVVAGKMLVAK